MAARLPMSKEVKPTKAQVRNLRHVAEHGKPVPRNSAAYHCRIKGLSEFLWLYEDGETSTPSEKTPCEGAYLVKIVGERLTPAGRQALEAADGQ
jgi:hypothetical protein